MNLDYRLSKNLQESSKNNDIRPRRKCQTFSAQSVQVSQIVASNPLRFVLSLPKTQRSMLNKLLTLSLRYPKLCIKQATLGSYVGISREWANKLLRFLEETGCIARNYMHMYINVYKVSPFFFQPAVRKILSGVLPALRYMCASLLLSIFPSNASIVQNFTHTNIKDNYLNNLLSVERLSNVRKIQITDRLYTESTIESHSIAKECMKFQRAREEKASRAIAHVSRILGLTRLGQIKLGSYPDEAIAYALSQMKYAKNVQDPFKFFCKICTQYCQDNDIIPDWEYMTTTIKEQNLSPSGSVSEDHYKKPVPEQFRYKVPTDTDLVNYNKPVKHETWTLPAPRVDDPVQLEIDRKNWYASKTPDFMRRLLGSEKEFAKFVRATIDPNYQSPPGTEDDTYLQTASSASSGSWKSIGSLLGEIGIKNQSG